MTDPSTAFFTAALAAGIVEGSSVLRYYAGVHSVSSEKNDINGKQPTHPHHEGPSVDGIQRSASLPSLAAYSLLYGVASVPLGVVGASPGSVFLPRSLRAVASPVALGTTQPVDEGHDAEDAKLTNHKNYANLTPDDSNQISEKISSLRNANSTVNQSVTTSSLSSPSAKQSSPSLSGESSSPIIAGTGRGMGRLLRQENMKKITAMHHPSNRKEHVNEPRKGGVTSADGVESANSTTNDNHPRPEVDGAIQHGSNGRKFSVSNAQPIKRTNIIPRTFRLTSKYSNLISTLDGSPLPTSLAEAMRRSRVLFVGAGLVSMALSRNHHYHNRNLDYGEDNDRGHKVGFHQIKNHETNNDMALQMRLRKGMRSSDTPFTTGISLLDDSISQIISRDRDDSLRNITRQVLFDAISTSLEWMQSNVGVDMNETPFRWIVEWKSKRIRGSGGDFDTRPIALRLVMDERQIPPATPSCDRDEQNEQNSDSPFLLLPLLCPGCCIQNADNISNNYWELGASPKDWTMLPLDSTWLHRSQRQESKTNEKISSMPPSLIIEANTAEPLRDVLRRRYADGLGNKSKQPFELENDSSSFDKIRFCTRILQNLVFERFGSCTTTSDDSAGNDHAMTTSIVIRSGGMTLDDKEMKSTPTNTIYFDALEILQSAFLSEVTRISRIPTLTQVQERCDKSASHIYAGLDGNQINSFAAMNESTSDDSKALSNSKRSKIWDIALTTVDMLGTSIRHLTISTYRFATAISNVFVIHKRQKKSHKDVEKDTSPKIIHIVSRNGSVSKWISEIFSSRGWKVNDCVTNGNRIDNKFDGGVVMVYGANDMDTCEMACTIMECNPHLGTNDDTKFILVLEETSNQSFAKAVVKSVRDRTMGSRSYVDKLTILCTSSIYEDTFAFIRERLAQGMTPSEANLQLIKSTSAECF